MDKCSFSMPLLLTTEKFITRRRRHNLKVPQTAFFRDPGLWKSSPESLGILKNATLELIKCVITVGCDNPISFRSDWRCMWLFCMFLGACEWTVVSGQEIHSGKSLLPYEMDLNGTMPSSALSKWASCQHPSKHGAKHTASTNSVLASHLSTFPLLFVFFGVICQCKPPVLTVFISV